MSPLKNGNFFFNVSQYSVYSIIFSLEPYLWGDFGEAIQFETKYFCAYNQATTKFDMEIYIELDNEKTVEFIACDNQLPNHTSVSTGKLPIIPTGMSLSVYIPSP